MCSQGNGLFAKKKGGGIKKVNNDFVLSLIFSPAVAIWSAAPALNLSHKLSISEEPWAECPSVVAGHCTKIFPVAMGVWGGRIRRGSEILSVLEERHPQRLQSPDRRLRLALWLWGLIRHLLYLIKRLSVTDTNTRANKLQRQKLHLLTYLINKSLSERLMKSKGNWNLN